MARGGKIRAFFGVQKLDIKTTIFIKTQGLF